ncbi:MAG: PspC domain-containing protein [Tannerellaceae bacterium]|jgi:phage shock protein PspC (stress-responsive transcriptional regulator)|nr:PspC domain-containing protein [Tannerellaceae bacterium]
MKKTLTVNLGGTVFHIDEDAYQLLDKYLSNLRIHFNKEEGADEIMSDFELRISEILNERVRLGNEVITLGHVEGVIKRMGKVEELFGEEPFSSAGNRQTHHTADEAGKERVNRRLFRNPDDRILGGICGGLAAYLGWDPTPVRLLIFLLMFFFGIIIPIYFILWLIIPMAHTATEKLQMRGESITVENIGKTVTDGFERVSSNVNDYLSSGKPRTALQRIADGLVDILGVILKAIAVLAGIILFPPLLFVLFILFIVIIALVAGGIGGGFGLLYHLMPYADWNMLNQYPEWTLLVAGICTVLLIGIPVISILYAVCSRIFKFKSLPNGVKWALLTFWFIALALNIFFAVRYGIPFWGDLNHWPWRPSYWRNIVQMLHV